MAKSMEIVPSGELQKQFGRYSDEAMIRPSGRQPERPRALRHGPCRRI